ncbi:MAG: hypothetical protein V1754_02210 [Pseudomonadota bacterium]
MSKRKFRATPTTQKGNPQYPTIDEFDTSRRDFLRRLGATVLGASALAAGLAACSDTTIPLPDMLQPPGVAPMLDARIDGQTSDSGPDATAGVPPAPDARIDACTDTSCLLPDIGHTQGIAPMFDARIDNGR